MTIDEAIEILEYHLAAVRDVAGTDYPKALQLGIEALKAWDKFREGRWVSGRYNLPGETTGKSKPLKGSEPGVRSKPAKRSETIDGRKPNNLSEPLGSHEVTNVG